MSAERNSHNRYNRVSISAGQWIAAIYGIARDSRSTQPLYSRAILEICFTEIYCHMVDSSTLQKKLWVLVRKRSFLSGIGVCQDYSQMLPEDIMPLTAWYCISTRIRAYFMVIMSFWTCHRQILPRHSQIPWLKETADRGFSQRHEYIGTDIFWRLNTRHEICDLLHAALCCLENCRLTPHRRELLSIYEAHFSIEYRICRQKRASIIISCHMKTHAAYELFNDFMLAVCSEVQMFVCFRRTPMPRRHYFNMVSPSPVRLVFWNRPQRNDRR
jgi:hypothetical protein